MRKVKNSYGDALRITWKPFALEQINTKEGPEWKLWEHHDDFPSRSLPGFLALEASRQQGADAYERLHWTLLEGRHEHRKDFRDPTDLEELILKANLDLKQLKRDLKNKSLLSDIAHSHTQAVKLHGIFGTPTFVFENGKSFFMRIQSPSEEIEATRIFENLLDLFVDRDSIAEVKRPTPSIE